MNPHRIPTPLLLPLALSAAFALSACQQPAGAAAAPAAAPAQSAEPAPATPAPATGVQPIVAESGTYTLDPKHTMVLAQWNHMGLSNPSANFDDVEGSIVYDAANPAASSVQVTVPLSGLRAFDADFEQHLAGSDFFEVARFPNATFRSTSVEAAGTNALKVTGDLTIKDISRPVTLDVTLNGAGQHPMLKVPAIGFDATTTVKRSDFGMDYGLPMVGDEVQLRITTEALQAAAAAPDAGAQGGQ